MSSLFEQIHNPDVLSCLANLSSDEVFTPPELANQMLDLLPQELWSDPNARFLDPACKSGVFLREIAKRLIKGLEGRFPDLQERLDHIYREQVFGIAITELTSLMSRRSLYCSKYPNSRYSVVPFDDAEGNVRFRRTEHVWGAGKPGERRCVYCGASEKEYRRDEALEQHAYEFIHTDDIEKVLDMKFDVIVSNPPYQLNDGGGTGSSAKPIYQLFVEQAKKLNPRYLTMIIPSRWFSGGKGLDKFRRDMLGDKHIRKLVDYENFRDVFPGVDLAGGACYFLWERDSTGLCEVTNFVGEKKTAAIRQLDEYGTFIRNNQAVDIVHKVAMHSGDRRLSDRVSSRLPFGIPTTYKPASEGVPCYFTQRIGRRPVRESDVKDREGLRDKWKFLVPKAPIAGQTDFSKPVAFYYDGNTRVAKPGEICSESWLVAGAFDSEEETLAFKSYLFTKTVRFLLLQTVVSQNITKKNFCFIPDFDSYVGRYTDKQLCEMWGLDTNDFDYIKTKIGEIGQANA